MTNFFNALVAAAQHFLPHVDNQGAQKILAVIDEAKKIADVAAPFIPVPQAAAVTSIIDEVDAVAHKIVPPAAPAPAPVSPAQVVTTPVASTPVVTSPSQPAPAPSPNAKQVLAADLAQLSQDLLKP